ncbi:MAG: RNA methyltransferase [Candidatus Nezhaarchaeota archaeon]|nr:RNA methyltransferase [Candidatus Nezhaarchaeota archaeon]
MPHVRVVLVEPLYEVNVGLTCRVMKNFGFRDLCIVKPRSHISDTARRFAVKAVDVLESASIVDELERAVEGFDIKVGTTGKLAGSRNVVRAVVPPWHLRRAVGCEGRIALLFGREDVGLTNEELSMCDIVVHIPTSDEYPVMNVTHAVAVLLYELSKHSVRPKVKLASGKLREVALNYFVEMLKLLEFPDGKKRKAGLAFKRLLGKSFASKKEMYMLLAFLRKAYLELSKGEPEKS